MISYTLYFASEQDVLQKCNIMKHYLYMYILNQLTSKLALGHKQPLLVCVSEALTLTHKVGRVPRLRMTDTVAPLSHKCLQGMHRDIIIFVNLNFVTKRSTSLVV